MLDGLPDAVFLVDRRRVIVDLNRAAKRLLGPDALGAGLEERLDNAHIAGAIDATLGGTPGTRSEVFLPFPVARHYELNVWRLPDLISSDPVWAMVVLRDITAAVKADRMRADFVANVSHELRSPLSSLLGFIETLRGPARDDREATERFLKIMEVEAKRMTRLINDLLALSKVETEEHIHPEESVALGPILNHVAGILTGRARERGMDIVFDLPGPLPQVQGDADELIQLFQNLISNAIGYGRAETPIRVTAALGEPDVTVAVINQGESIPAEEIPRLTERFYRTDKGRSRSMGGTGLGLAIVKHIVARHRGRLAIASPPGGETSFAVSLPRAKT